MMSQCWLGTGSMISERTMGERKLPRNSGESLRAYRQRVPTVDRSFGGMWSWRRSRETEPNTTHRIIATVRKLYHGTEEIPSNRTKLTLLVPIPILRGHVSHDTDNKIVTIVYSKTTKSNE